MIRKVPDPPGSPPELTNLASLRVGQSARIIRVGGEESFRLRLIEMGMLRGESVQLLRFAPLGDPMELLVGGYHLSLRKQDARNILVTPL